ncbi:hypothetical protein C1H46_010254 [Malus baccata]|uniref:Uncharacterized protein n=1 Tax=Malus baccata TaxID=106549 RepID=A0A540MZD1_MALBA|nr:hypothetical protein C1H46_010254 [Malus baccata]
MLPDLGQNSQPLSSQYSGVLELSQQGRRQQHMELGTVRVTRSILATMLWNLDDSLKGVQERLWMYL